MNAWRGAFGVTTRQCLRVAGPATLAATVVAAEPVLEEVTDEAESVEAIEEAEE